MSRKNNNNNNKKSTTTTYISRMTILQNSDDQNLRR